MINLTPLILLLPLAGFVVLGLFGRYLPRAIISLIACGVVLVAFGAAVADFISMLGVPVAGRSSVVTIWHWVSSGGLSINFNLLSDPLSAVMLLVVTGVGFLIHVYSIGYMEDDPGYWRFFSFLNFFVFAMALLVTANNFLFLLIGWAGVGLASFLLIGFWYTRPAAVAAAKKAFVVNVIGDFGLMLAIFLLFRSFGTLTYQPIFGSVGTAGIITPGELTAITLLLFVAAAAKSAQLPLHVWLPDAMEGPTPVSALIHAATMVTAGVYLVARAAPLYSVAPDSLGIIGGVAGVTAFFAATIACVQTDIKRVLAYSTMSQLGYMFMAESATGFTTGIFHLTTHAYFKALLFMCAGAVMHALSGELDMRKMGGLRSRLPFTFWTFVIGGLALAAIFPFAGFWSKDAVLGLLLARATTSGVAGWWILWGLGILTAALTGFYTFRLIFGIFSGEYRGGPIAPVHGEHAAPAGDPLAAVHEVGMSMKAPMFILAILSIIGGFYGTPWADWIGEFLAPVTGGVQAPTVGTGPFWIGLAISLAVALGGIAVAWQRYGARQARFEPGRNPVVVLLEHRYYIDELYDLAIVRPTVALGGATRRAVEGVTLDGGTRAVAWVVGQTSAGMRKLQTGFVRNYALAIFLGAAIIVLFYVVWQ
jgi:NADH-quinone oxidoreductase subunit L